MNLHKKCTTKPYSFLMIDTTLASDNPLRFRKNLSVTTDDKIRDEKLQFYSRTSELHRILLNFTDKIDLKRREILASTLHGPMWKE